jgi:PAS domain S-box-containing protein
MTKFYKNNISEFSSGEYKKDDLLRFAENIIENSNNIFYEHDLEWEALFLSASKLRKYLGYSPSESNLKWQQLLTENPANKNAYLSKQKAIATRKKQPTYEVEVYSKSGDKVWLEIREAPMCIKDGKVVSIAGAAIDITERKKDEEEIQKLALIVEQTDNGIIITGMR